MKTIKANIAFLTPLLDKIRSKEMLASPFSAGLILLLVSLVSYSLVIPRLGFYWDSWPMNWIAQTRGTQGLAQYFSTNRPVWGLLYQVSMPLLGGAPLPWQIFGLLWRWLAGMALWGVIRLLWPRQPEPALWAGLLFVIYPAFQQQSIGLLYGHFFIVVTAFLTSLACSLLAIRKPGWRAICLVVGLLLSAANLLMMEYFFLLELLRPLLLWLALGEQPESAKSRLRKTLTAWVPYLLVFLGAVFWRGVLFPFQTNNYSLVTLSQFAAQPLLILSLLAQRALEEIWIATGQAWIYATQPPQAADIGEVNVTRYLLLMIATGLALFLAGQLLASRRQPSNSERLIWVKESLLVAVLGLALAGWPFWLTNVPFSLAFAYDRFTLPFVFGASLLLISLIMLLPWRPMRWLVFATLVGLAAGFQFQTGLAYRQDWVDQQQLFWQLRWRVPNLAPGTVIFANETWATAYSTDNSLTAPLNWIYDADNHSQTIRYLLVYPTIRLNPISNLKLEKDTPVSEDLLVGKFEGNTSQSITIYYDYSNCLRVVDPVIDGLNPLIPDELKKTAEFSDFSLIQPLPTEQTTSPPLPNILGQPPNSSWCQLYEQADLLRVSGKWYNILDLWKTGKDLVTRSNFAAELVPFVEAYARTYQWNEAAILTVSTQKSRPVFCSLWYILDQTTPESEGKQPAVRASMDLLKCSEYGIFPRQP